MDVERRRQQPLFVFCSPRFLVVVLDLASEVCSELREELRDHRADQRIACVEESLRKVFGRFPESFLAKVSGWSPQQERAAAWRLAGRVRNRLLEGHRGRL